MKELVLFKNIDEVTAFSSKMKAEELRLEFNSDDGFLESVYDRLISCTEDKEWFLRIADGNLFCRDWIIRDVIINALFTVNWLESMDKKVPLNKIIPEKDLDISKKIRYKCFDEIGDFSKKYVERRTNEPSNKNNNEDGDEASDESKKPKKRYLVDFNLPLQTVLLCNQSKALSEEQPVINGVPPFKHVPIDNYLEFLSEKVSIYEKVSERYNKRGYKEICEPLLHMLIIVNGTWEALDNGQQYMFYYGLERIFHSNLILSLISELTDKGKMNIYLRNEDFILDNMVALSKIPTYIPGKISFTDKQFAGYVNLEQLYPDMMRKGFTILYNNFGADLQKIKAYLASYIRNHAVLLDYHPVVNDEKDIFKCFMDYNTNYQSPAANMPLKIREQFTDKGTIFKVFFKCYETITGIYVPFEREWLNTDFHIDDIQTVQSSTKNI